jgi:uncharacterized HAD superfamily protein
VVDMERKIIKASKGMILTDGEIYGKTIYLADDEDKSMFKEITQEEYEKFVEESEENLRKGV